MSLTARQEDFLVALEEAKGNLAEVARIMNISYGTVYNYAKDLREEIQTRTRDKLTLGAFKAAEVMVDTLDADSTTEKGELRLKASAEVLDRSGITKHTNIDVSVGEGVNGLFIIPAKAEVPPEE